MAPLSHSCSFTKVLFLVLGLVFVFSSFIPAHSEVLQVQPENNVRSSRRMMEVELVKKKTSTSKNQTKLLKSTTTSSSKNHTKLIKNPSVSGFGSIKNQTKLSKSKLAFSDSKTKNPTSTITFKSQLQKLNPTPSKSSNSTKITTKKTSDLPKISSNSSPKNKTTKTQLKKDTTDSKSKTPPQLTGKTTKTQLKKDTTESKSKTPQLTGKDNKTQLKKDTTDSKSKTPTVKTQQKSQKSSQYSWVEDDEDDLISEFRDFPSKFQETLLPDLEKISKTSKVYLNKANKEITKNFKPYVGTKYAPAIASIISFAFILIPLILVSLIFNKIKAYFSLQKLLIFIQVYLSIYFFILCLSSLITGLEPLKFFYNTAQSTYICLQLLQTLAYVLYLLMLLMYLILVFSTETGTITKLIGLAQTIVGFAVGLHYYMTVFHRTVLHQPPKTSYKVHAIYAMFFLAICFSSNADTRKKAYLVQGGEVEKKS